MPQLTSSSPGHEQPSVHSDTTWSRGPNSTEQIEERSKKETIGHLAVFNSAQETDTTPEGMLESGDGGVVVSWGAKLALRAAEAGWLCPVPAPGASDCCESMFADEYIVLVRG